VRRSAVSGADGSQPRDGVTEACGSPVEEERASLPSSADARGRQRLAQTAKVRPRPRVSPAPIAPEDQGGGITDVPLELVLVAEAPPMLNRDGAQILLRMMRSAQRRGGQISLRGAGRRRPVA
jgi:hypothetical protein